MAANPPHVSNAALDALLPLVNGSALQRVTRSGKRLAAVVAMQPRASETEVAEHIVFNAQVIAAAFQGNFSYPQA